MPPRLRGRDDALGAPAKRHRVSQEMSLVFDWLTFPPEDAGLADRRRAPAPAVGILPAASTACATCTDRPAVHARVGGLTRLGRSFERVPDEERGAWRLTRLRGGSALGDPAREAHDVERIAVADSRYEELSVTRQPTRTDEVREVETERAAQTLLRGDQYATARTALSHFDYSDSLAETRICR